jgi:hypothetical protein
MFSTLAPLAIGKPKSVKWEPELTINPIRLQVDANDSEMLALEHALNVSVDINVPVGGNAQSAINSAQAGDVVVLQAGAVYSLLTLKSDIPVRSSRASECVGRVAPGNSCLAKVQSSVPAEPVITVPIGTKNWKIDGLEVSTSSSSVVVYDLVKIGEGRQLQKTVDQVPQNGMIDHSYIHGWSDQDVQRGIALNAGATTVQNSYVSDVHMVGIEAQGIAAWNGPGPFRIINNHVEASTQGALFGGADPASEALTPSNISFLQNYLFKPLSWKVGDPSYAGKHWTVKNILEFKNAKNATVDGNVFENVWTDGQTGLPILFTVRNQECSAPYSTIQNITFTNNTVKGAEGGLNFLGKDNEAELSYGKCPANAPRNPDGSGSVRGSGVTVNNNLFYDIKGPFITLNGFNNVGLFNNTHPDQKGNLTTLYGDQSFGFKYKNNLTNDHQYSFFGDGGYIGTAAFAKYAPDAEVAGNYIGNAQEGAAYPNGNHIMAALIPLPADFRSPFADGGANIDALKAAQSGSAVSLPTPSPTPSISPSPTATPTPVVTPSPTPTATPTPSPSPAPTPSCVMTVSGPTLPQWSSGKLVVTFVNLTQSGTVKAVASTGQVSVDTVPQTINAGTSSYIAEFWLQSKKKSSSVTVSGPCGSKTVMVNVQ